MRSAAYCDEDLFRALISSRASGSSQDERSDLFEALQLVATARSCSTPRPSQHADLVDATAEWQQGVELRLP
jgi:hypothetical protein